jgi:hypothetical protein
MRRLACVLVALVLTGCSPVWLETPVLTPDGTDRYDVAGTRGSELAVTAPASNVGGNLRVGLIDRDAPVATVQTSCATWHSWHDGTQPGALLRWTGTRGVTVTKNVWGGAFWVLNVHVWDTSSPQPYTLVAQFDAPELWSAPWPWRLCATAAGQQVSFTLDTTAADVTGTATVPVMPGEGRAGWYMGHLAPGRTAVLTDLRQAP